MEEGDYYNEGAIFSNEKILKFKNSDSLNKFPENKTLFSNKLNFFHIYKNKYSTMIPSLIEKTKYTEFNYFRKELKTLLEELNKITKKIEEDNEDEEKKLEWKFAGIVLDKLFLYIFTFLTTILTCIILLTAPNFFKMK